MIVRKIFDKVLKDDHICRPMTPSHWIKTEPEYQEVTMLRMTCGGGLGSAQWFEYIERIPLYDLAQKNVFVAKTYEGDNILVNMRYVVNAKQMRIARAYLSSQNPNFEVGDYEYQYLMNEGHEVELRR